MEIIVLLFYWWAHCFELIVVDCLFVEDGVDGAG